MMSRVFVARDSCALSVGADSVAQAIAAEAALRGQAIEIVRTGSRGLLWLEPLIEVETPDGRVAYGPVAERDVAELFASDFLRGGRHRLGHGLTEQIRYLARQQRRTFARMGLIDPLRLDDYVQHGGYRGLRQALAMGPGAAVQALVDSGLRGRGGAAFPTGIKWKTVLEQQSATKYVVCNADEGDSGTFS
ncbi:MAG TPA: formate dehydrogenase, partial [Burkholderiaceae bacterium]|nr:formate dehydrogenase [Burkholderiaceae bacterium]